MLVILKKDSQPTPEVVMFSFGRKKKATAPTVPQASNKSVELKIKFHTAQTCLALNQIYTLEYRGYFRRDKRCTLEYPIYHNAELLATVYVPPLAVR
jgi:hypothetical protein